jgi:hypothetical protein
MPFLKYIQRIAKNFRSHFELTIKYHHRDHPARGTTWRGTMTTTKTKPKSSRKARVRELYNERGSDEAFTFGRRLQLKPSTLHSWFGAWRREAAKAKAERTRDRTVERNATKAQRQQEAKAELAAQTATTEPASGPAEGPLEVQPN